MDEEKRKYKKIMKHICDDCCNADCPQGKKNKLECIRYKKERESKKINEEICDNPLDFCE